MNSGYYPIILAVIYLAIHVISALAKESAQRHERDRKREAAERRRATEVQAEPSLTRPANDVSVFTPPPATAPSPVTSGSRSLDSLAAMRKQQLEELRARQMGRTATSPQVRVGKPPAASTSQSAQQATMRAPGAQRIDPFAERRELERRDRERREQREQAATRAQKQSRIARQRELAAKSKAAAELRERKLREAADRAAGEKLMAETGDLQPASQSRINPLLTSITNRLANPQTVREWVILKEILDPPLSMREL